jgi:nicotinamidase-related amidase
VTAVLLVVDVQHDFLVGPPAAYQADRLLTVIAHLQKRARAAAVPIVHVRFAGEAGHLAAAGRRVRRSTRL